MEGLETNSEGVRPAGLSGARCAQHPGTVALGACARCGDFGCAACFVREEGRCVRCSLSRIAPEMQPDGTVVIPVPGLGRRLVLVPSMLTGPKLTLDGQKLVRKKGVYGVRQPEGPELRIKLKPRFVDPYPRMFVDDVEVVVAKGMPVLATLWASVPVLCLFLGGCIGGMIGVVASTANYKILRSSYSPLVRYLLVGAVNVGTIFFFLMLAGMAALRQR